MRCVSTLHYPLRQPWASLSECLVADSPGRTRRLMRILKAARGRLPIVLNGFSRTDQVAAILLARRTQGAPIVMTDCTWQGGTHPVDRLITSVGIRAMRSPRITFCVSSEAELPVFARRWEIDPRQVAVVPWYHGLTDADLRLTPTRDGEIVSAGYALRDYDLLLEAAPLISAPIWIGTHPALLGHRAAGMPSNVTVSHVPRGEFLERLRRASAVVVPLERRQDRSAGQTTYLTAMALGKIVVVTDSIGVSDHIEDGRTGFIVPPGDSRALAAAITAVLDPAENERMTAVATAAAKAARTRFSPEEHLDRLLRVVAAATG